MAQQVNTVLSHLNKPPHSTLTQQQQEQDNMEPEEYEQLRAKKMRDKVRLNRKLYKSIGEYLLNKKVNIPKQKNVRFLDYLEGHILPYMEENDLDYDNEQIEALNLMIKSYRTYETLKDKTKKHSKEKKNKWKTDRDALFALDIPNIEKLTKEYLNKGFSNAKGLEKLKFFEMAIDMNENIYEIASNTREFGDTRAIGISTTALVNNLKDFFSDRLEMHYKSGVASAKGQPQKGAEHLSGILNDCILTSGIYYMKESDLEKEGLSTTRINSNPQTYNKYYKNFQCLINKPNLKNKKDNAENFRKYQCELIYSYSNIIKEFKKKYATQKTVCGKKLEDFDE